MDHRLIRQNARYVIKGNILNIWVPLFIIEFISLPFSILILQIAEAGSNLEKILSIIASLLLMPLVVGSYEIYLNMVRNKRHSLKSLFSYFDRFGTILAAIAIMAILVTAGSFLFTVSLTLISSNTPTWSMACR